MYQILCKNSVGRSLISDSYEGVKKEYRKEHDYFAE